MRWLTIGLSLAYPLLVLAGLKWLAPRILGLLVLLFVVGRVVFSRQGGAFRRPVLVVPVLVLLVLWIGITSAFNDARGLFLMPVLINAVLLVTFAQSLFRPPSVVETLARLRVADLSPAEVSYCRAVTRVWCVFFLLNGGVIVWLACAASAEQWALYTGFVSYALIGALFGAEFVYRHYRFRRYVGSLADPFLKRLFPPREAS